MIKYSAISIVKLIATLMIIDGTKLDGFVALKDKEIIGLQFIFWLSPDATI